jgi:hypothetical protein
MPVNTRSKAKNRGNTNGNTNTNGNGNNKGNTNNNNAKNKHNITLMAHRYKIREACIQRCAKPILPNTKLAHKEYYNAVANYEKGIKNFNKCKKACLPSGGGKTRKGRKAIKGSRKGRKGGRQ